MIVRPAEKADEQRILDIINEVDIGYPSLTLDDFFVLEDEGDIIGCAKVDEFPSFSYLSSFAVAKGGQKKGLGLKFLSELLKGIKKDVWLYTIHPGFFGKLGFTVAKPTDRLPSKSMYLCEECRSDRCASMVKRHEGS